MARQLEEWEWDMVLEGDAPPEVERAAKATPDYQARLAQARAAHRTLFHHLYRAECPEALELGEWQLQRLGEARQAEIAAHLQGCPHCQEEVEGFARLSELPLRAGWQEAAGQMVKRIVMKLESLLAGGEGVPAVALRGSAWSACYTGGDFMLTLTRERDPNGAALLGTLLSDEASGEVLLRQAGTVRYKAPIGAGASFSFRGISPGHYDLVIETPTVELVVEDLDLASS